MTRRKVAPDITHQATYCELQYVDDHEVLWFQVEGGRWVGMILPPGKTFGADVEVQDA